MPVELFRPCLVLLLTSLCAPLVSAHSKSVQPAAEPMPRPLVHAPHNALPKASPVPGGIALVPINAPSATLNGRPLLVVPANTAHHTPYVAVVGIDLKTAPGIVTIDTPAGGVNFEVKSKQYREQRLTIKNKRKVNPEQRDMARIGRERTEMLAALGNWRDQPAVTHFILPAEGPFSSPFGLRRFFNDQPRAPHSGLDIAASKGAPIVAPAPGRVTAAGDYFFNGRNLILDHGQGLVTMYSHMDRIDVEVGDEVKTGQLLGTVGNSGRVTGPHLHWTVSLNNVRVDPMLFIDTQPAE